MLRVEYEGTRSPRGIIFRFAQILHTPRPPVHKKTGASVFLFPILVPYLLSLYCFKPSGLKQYNLPRKGLEPPRPLTGTWS